MPWLEVSLMSNRVEFVRLASGEGGNVSELCRRFGISRKTGYKWLARDRAGAGLEDASRRPRSSPSRSPAAVEASVLALRAEHPSWGGRKLRRRLLDVGASEAPSASTITAILARHGCIDPAEGSNGRRSSALSILVRMLCGRWTSRAISPLAKGAATR